MASVKFEKKSKEWYMFQEYWKICQKFWIPEDNDDYWDQMNADVSKFMKEYEGISLARELAVSLIETLDKQHRMGGVNK